MSSRSERGFSLIEILVVITILAVVVTIIIISLSKLNSSQALDKGASLVVSVLDQARSLTLSAKDDSQYGVHFEDSGVVLFKGSVYSSSDPLNISTSIDGRVGIRNVSLAGGGSDVVFKRLTGSTDQAGTLELFLKASPTTIRTINVTITGVASMNTP